MPREFSWYDPHPNDSHPFEVTDGSFYKYCIPYKGNEHLAGTNKDINMYVIQDYAHK